MLPIELFTPEEQAQIPAFQAKWRKVALSTERIDRVQAEAAIRAVYKNQWKRSPQVIFCDSPLAAAECLAERVKTPQLLFSNMAEPIGAADEGTPQAQNLPTSGSFFKAILYALLFTWKSKAMQKNPLSNLIQDKQTFQAGREHLVKKAEQQFAMQNLTMADFVQEIVSQFPEAQREMGQVQIPEPVAQPKTPMGWYEKFFSKFALFFLKQNFIGQVLARLSDTRLGNIDQLLQMVVLARLQEKVQLVYSLSPIASAISGNTLDFCNTVIAAPKKPRQWNILKTVYEQCGWIFISEGVCYICDRPTKLKLDDEYRPHAEGEAAIKYSDGTKIYAYHGALLPEQYGQTLPIQWQAQWLLQETNAELRRALIQGIGYDRLCQDLDAIELDTWEEYTLLKVKDSIDVEDLHLLKMTCPSTGHIHAMRVPPKITSAREAIKWMNWDTDPAQFAVQT
jgi:hypothetical protein